MTFAVRPSGSKCVIGQHRARESGVGFERSPSGNGARWPATRSWCATATGKTTPSVSSVMVCDNHRQNNTIRILSACRVSSTCVSQWMASRWQQRPTVTSRLLQSEWTAELWHAGVAGRTQGTFPASSASLNVPADLTNASTSYFRSAIVGALSRTRARSPPPTATVLSLECLAECFFSRVSTRKWMLGKRL